MSEQANGPLATATATPTKKQVRKEIVEKLNGALADYKKELGEKKLATRVKEVSKLISRDLKRSNKSNKKKQEKRESLKKTRQKSAKAKAGQKK